MRSTLCVVVLLSAFLSGCFSSEKPLLTEDDAVTPLPDAFALYETDRSGNLKTNEKGEAVVTNFARVGKVYVERGEKTTSTLTLMKLDMKLDGDSNIFLAQYVISLNEKQKDESRTVIYMIGKRLDNIIFSYAPPFPGKTGPDAALKDAGVAFTINGLKFFTFSDKTQLLAAARVYASRLEEGSITRYRIAVSRDEIAALQKEIEAARPKRVAPAAPETAASSPAATRAPSQDAGAANPNGCDQRAAHPADPNRMAVGVKLEGIVPRLAVQECERAVSEYPNTARFRYQLGRAQEASGNMPAAIASYQQAGAMGYGMAWYNLGIDYSSGKGVPADSRIAEEYLRKAMAAKIDVRDELREIVFSTDGYSNPQFFDAIYNGRLSVADAKGAGIYLMKFVDLFRNTPDCQRVISGYAYSQLEISGQQGAIGQMLGALAGANRNYRPGDFGAAAQSGIDAGKGFNQRLAMQLSKAEADAQMFYDRHGCHSAVSSQFFRNLESIASRL
jgi:TPR repeat protein